MDALALEGWSGAAFLLSDEELLALRRGVQDDDPALVQHVIAAPAVIVNPKVIPQAEGACLLCYGMLRVSDRPTIADLQNRYGEINRDTHFAARSLARWWDETPRGEARAAMLPLIDAELARRDC